MIKLAVFVSGRGSNLKSILQKIDSGKLDASVSAVISDKKECPALSFSEEQGISTFSVSAKEKEGYCSYNYLVEQLVKLEVDLIVLAGFLKKIPDELVDHFENKIINIHPALLPSFGGKGMYGANVHKAVYESSAKVSGATVHFVNKVYDEGRIIAQRCVDISMAASPDEIAAKVLEIEHELLPAVIQSFCENRVKIINNRVEIN